MKISKPGLYAWALCAVAVLLFARVGREALHSSSDLMPVFDGSSCMLHGCDPFNRADLTTQLQRQYQLPSWSLCCWGIYPPSTLLALSPLALVPLSTARLIWFLLNCGLVIAAGVLVLSLCPSERRWLATVLVLVFLEGFSRLLVLGQPSAFAIATVIIGSYLFLRGRFLLPGSIILMMSLAVKPQIGGLIVLYFFVRGVHRRYAAFAMAGAFALLVAGGTILSLNPGSAGWISELHTNLSVSQEPDGTNDQRPSSRFAIEEMNLQTITSVFLKDEGAFNDAAYAISVMLLITLIFVLLRMNSDIENQLLAIGALSALTLMPVYHRIYDCRLLLLCIPSVLIVFEKRRVMGSLLCSLIFFTNYSLQMELRAFLQHHGLWQPVLRSKLLFILLARERSWGLLALFCLYVVILYQRDVSRMGAVEGEDQLSPVAG